MKRFITTKISFRKAADFKRLLVKYLPTFILKKINGVLINFVPREIYTSDVLFIHVPKVAGTSISRSLYGKSIGHQTANFIYKVEPSLKSEKISISILRDPVERAYSAFQFMKIGGTDDVAVEKLKSYDGCQYNDFSSFVKNWLEPNFDNVHSFDYVFWPQSWFVCNDDGDVLVDRIFFMDDIASLESFLLDAGYVKGKLERANASGFDSKSVFINEETKDIIRKLYKKDYDLMKNIKLTKSV